MLRFIVDEFHWHFLLIDFFKTAIFIILFFISFEFFYWIFIFSSDYPDAEIIIWYYVVCVAINMYKNHLKITKLAISFILISIYINLVLFEHTFFFFFLFLFLSRSTDQNIITNNNNEEKNRYSSQLERGEQGQSSRRLNRIIRENKK